MKFEQSSGLNEHVDATIPFTWPGRWRAVKPALPLLVCCSILFLELLLLRMWLNDRSIIAELPRICLVAACPILLAFVLFEVRMRVFHRTRRMIAIEEKQVSIRPAKCERIKWNQILAWRFEPLEHGAGLTVLTMEYQLTRGGNIRRSWPIVLNRDQQDAFLSELEHLGERGVNTAPLILSREPFAKKALSGRAPGMIAFACAFLLLAHGFPMFVVGLMPPRRERDEPRTESTFTPAEQAKLGQVALRHFSSLRQFRAFLLITGGSMTLLAVAFVFWGDLRVKRSRLISEPKPD